MWSGLLPDPRTGPYSFPQKNMAAPHHLDNSFTLDKNVTFDLDPLLEILKGSVRKYSRETMRLALDYILNRGQSVTSTSYALGIKRTSLQHYLKKLNIVLKPAHFT